MQELIEGNKPQYMEELIEECRHLLTGETNNLHQLQSIMEIWGYSIQTKVALGGKVYKRPNTETLK